MLVSRHPAGRHQSANPQDGVAQSGAGSSCGGNHQTQKSSEEEYDVPSVSCLPVIKNEAK